MRPWCTTLTQASTVFFVLGACVVLAADANIPDRVTFHKDVMLILQENCQSCHRQGGQNIAGMVAPMSLTTYEEVRPWAKSIARQVQNRIMPPWDATPSTAGVFANERTLTQQEIDVIVKWVGQGAPRGRSEDAPPPKVFKSDDGWVLGTPDLVVSIWKEPYWVSDDAEDDQPRYSVEITEEMLPDGPRWLRAVEYQPDSEVVHHITGRGTGPPIGDRPEERFSLGSIAAGEDPTMYPPGFGNLLRVGTVVSGSMHYHKEVGPGTGAWDDSRIGFYFHPPGTKIEHTVTWGGMSNGSFEIPPGHANWKVGAAKVFEKDTILFSLHPHMHYRGKDMKYTAIYPDGSKELLLDVNDYDYGWQTNYIYRHPKLLPAGTLIEVVAHYDNSEARKELVPKLNVGRAVRFGAASTDEMMVPFIAWTAIEPDEVEKFKSMNLEVAMPWK